MYPVVLLIFEKHHGYRPGIPESIQEHSQLEVSLHWTLVTGEVKSQIIVSGVKILVHRPNAGFDRLQGHSEDD